MGRVCRMHGREGECTQDFWWESQKKKTIGRHRRRRKDNIKIYLREQGWGGMDSIHLAQDKERMRAVVNMVINLRVL
jgi:hypothetical protein